MKEDKTCSKGEQCGCKSGESFIGLAAVLGGIFFLVALFFLIFARDQVALLIPLVWGFVVLGIVLGAYQLKVIVRKPDEKKKK